MLGAEAREANKAWLMQQVNHVLEPLMLELVREKPTDTVSFVGQVGIDAQMIHLSDY